MSTFWITIAATIIGGVIAKAFSDRLDRAFQAPISRDAATIELYPRATLILMAAYLVVVAWASMFAMVVAMIWAGVSGERYVPVGVLVSMGLFIVVTPFYMILAILLRCPRCRRRILVQTVTKPPFGETSRHLNAWGLLILRIAFHGRFRCMYCGQAYAVEQSAIEVP